MGSCLSLPGGATGFVFVSGGVFDFPFSGTALHLLFCEVDFDSPVGPDFAVDFAIVVVARNVKNTYLSPELHFIEYITQPHIMKPSFMIRNK